MQQETTRLDDWWKTPIGQYLLTWEQMQVDEVLPNMFGYHALQLGSPQLDALASNRMPHRWLGLTQGASLAYVVTSGHSGKQGLFFVDSTALPFQNDSLDLIVLPHTLELSSDAHATLREVARVLRPEGRVVVIGLNPFSLWSLKRWQAEILSTIFRRERSQPVFPAPARFLNYWRLLDWLRLLDFEVQELRLGIYQPAVCHAAWIQRWTWINHLGQRWWPMFGAVYLVSATKKVHGMRLLGPAWRTTLKTKTVAPAASWFKP